MFNERLLKRPLNRLTYSKVSVRRMLSCQQQLVGRGHKLLSLARRHRWASRVHSNARAYGLCIEGW